MSFIDGYKVTPDDTAPPIEKAELLMARRAPASAPASAPAVAAAVPGPGRRRPAPPARWRVIRQQRSATFHATARAARAAYQAQLAAAPAESSWLQRREANYWVTIDRSDLGPALC